MMILVPIIFFFFLLASVTLYLYLAGAFHTFPPKAFRFAVCMLLLFFALTIVAGIVVDRSDIPLAVTKV
jgi:hypothetical protein